jgi:O-methyltransferase
MFGSTLTGKARERLQRYEIIRKLARARNRMRFGGLYKKYRPYTMIQKATYVRNLELAARVRDIPGCVIECGVWRGGMIAGIREYLGPDRHYFLFDSFQGLPNAMPIDGPHAAAWQADVDSPTYFNNATASIEEVECALKFQPDKNYTVVSGWFDDTMPAFKPPCGIALLRLDADLYESTKSALLHLAPHLANGGLIIVDDYHSWDGCTRAVHEYLIEHAGSAKPMRLMQHANDVFYLTQ